MAAMTPAPESAPTPAQDAAVARVVAFFEAMTPASLDALDTIYSTNAYFKDPFNEVRGIAEVRQIFSHMYAALGQPRFVVTDCIAQGGQCFLSWNFEFYFKNLDPATLQTVRGGSHLKFTTGGLVDFHRDYWDAAEELYEKLPLVGSLMRWLKKRAKQ